MPVRHPFPAGAAEQLAPLLPEIKTKAIYQRFQCVWLRATLPLSAPQMAQALGWKPSPPVIGEQEETQQRRQLGES